MTREARKIKLKLAPIDLTAKTLKYLDGLFVANDNELVWYCWKDGLPYLYSINGLIWSDEVLEFLEEDPEMDVYKELAKDYKDDPENMTQFCYITTQGEEQQDNG